MDSPQVRLYPNHPTFQARPRDVTMPIPAFSAVRQEYQEARKQLQLQVEDFSCFTPTKRCPKRFADEGFGGVRQLWDNGSGLGSSSKSRGERTQCLL